MRDEFKSTAKYIIYIDEAYVPTVSSAGQTLPSPALGPVLRERWGWSRCRRRRDGRKAACLGRSRGTRRVAICGRIRCVGVSAFLWSFAPRHETHHCIITSPKSSVMWQTQRVLSPLELLSRPVVGVDMSGSVIVVGEMLLYGSWYPL